MNITDVKVWPVQNSKIKANASITINDEFVVTGLKVMEGSKGLFVSMPSKKVNDDFKDVAFPITAEARAAINDAVLLKYGDTQQSYPIDDSDNPFKE